MSKIIGVIIQDETGKFWRLPAPNRHANLIILMSEHYLNTTDGDIPKIIFQGFYTENDEILSREKAYELVNKTGQTKINRPSERLFSEDLW